MKKNIVTVVIIASVCGFFGGREIMAENSASHAVKKGDTLWDISEGYLADPLLWPKVWKFNPKIANPNLIRPGQVVKIPGIMRSTVRTAPVQSETATVDSDSSALAQAGMASSSKPLPLIVVKRDSSQDDKQPGKTKEISQDKYFDRGIGIITSQILKDGTVLNTPQGWSGAAAGETIRIAAPGARVGQEFGVYRDLGDVAPLTYYGESPGRLLEDIAILEVVASDASGQQAIIRRAFAEVKTGDILGQVPQPHIIPASKVKAGAPFVKGKVVAFHLLRQVAGPDDIVYLNIGAAHGLAPGDLLSVAAADSSEKRTSGEVMVLRVATKTATAMVTKQSGHEVRLGDVVGAPAL